MKKFISLSFSLFLAAGMVLISCDKRDSGTNNSGDTVDIGYCVNDTTNPFLGWLTTTVQKLAAEDGVNIQIADASNNSAKQLEQIENFIAMKVKVIAMYPVDPNNVQDVIKRAQSQGIKIMVSGNDTGVQDFMMNIDQYACGKSIAELGIEWILKTFTSDGNPDSLPAGGKKLKVIVIKDTVTIDAKNRSDGIVDGLNEFGKLNVVISPTETQQTAQAMAIMENIWQQNNDAVACFTYNGSAAVGVNEYIMGQVNLDKSKFGVFTGDWSEEFQTLIDASPENKSVIRATMRIAGPQINGEPVPLEDATWIFMKDLYEGKMSYGKAIYDAMAKAYPQAAEGKR
ncbi:MAG: sugar ABC transporter substrate-binding protein [Spirochaetaceae bacterium]|jgi:ribose transport system substrate-binding protein|nr:sugar ABC transporter substrate-binding protein [Spirochaetaceae bacterium]